MFQRPTICSAPAIIWPWSAPDSHIACKPICSDIIKLLFFLPVLVWGAVIFYIISIPPGSIPESGLLQLPHIDKVIHFSMFAVFGSLLAGAFMISSKTQQHHKATILISLFTGFIYGGITEYYQYCCLDGRYGNIPDVLANCFGTVFGVFIIAMLFQSRIRP